MELAKICTAVREQAEPPCFNTPQFAYNPGAHAKGARLRLVFCARHAWMRVACARYVLGETLTTGACDAIFQIASHAPAVHDLSSLCLHLFRWRKCMHPNRIACFCCLWSVNPLPSSVSVLTDHGLCVFLFFHRFLCGACRLLP